MGWCILPRKKMLVLYIKPRSRDKWEKYALLESVEPTFSCCACNFQSSAPFGPGHKLPPCPGIAGGCWWIIDLLLYCLLLCLVKLISIWLKKSS